MDTKGRGEDAASPALRLRTLQSVFSASFPPLRQSDLSYFYSFDSTVIY